MIESFILLTHDGEVNLFTLTGTLSSGNEIRGFAVVLPLVLVSDVMYDEHVFRPTNVHCLFSCCRFLKPLIGGWRIPFRLTDQNGSVVQRGNDQTFRAHSNNFWRI